MKLKDDELRSIAIIGCYFGSFPYYIDLWLKSCALNPTVDWIIFTDQELIGAPPNVRQIKMSFDELRKLFKDKLSLPIVLDRPYKICDFRPSFGIVLEEYLKDYDFWGHCDFDMIFGDIRKFITSDILETYEKLLWSGHLTLYRNTPEVNRRYQLPGHKIDYKTAFCNDKEYAFDEGPINQIYQHHHIPVYHQIILADISNLYHRFRMNWVKNYFKQIFFWEKGQIFRAYQRNKQIFQEEYIYVHYQRRSFDQLQYGFNSKNAEAFFITPNGFFEKTPGVIRDEDFNYNKNPGFIYEFYEKERFDLQHFMKYNGVIRWLRKGIH